MAEKRIKGVIVPRHDTAINWAKATNFVPNDGELIIFSADDSTVISSGYDLSGLVNAEGTITATNANGSTGTFIPEPSIKTRFKFGDGKTNVNLLPFVETNGSSSNESKMRVTKRNNSIIELLNIKAIEDVAVIHTTAPAGTVVNFYNKNLIDPSSSGLGATGHYAYSGAINFNSLEVPNWCTPSTTTQSEFTYSTSKERGVSFIELTTSSLAPTSGVLKLTFTTLQIDFKATVKKSTRYRFFIDAEAKEDEIGEYNYKIYNAWLVEVPSEGISSTVDENGNVNTSNISYPYSLVILDNSLFNNSYELSVSYNTECIVNSEYNSESEFPLSGQAVKEALKTANFMPMIGAVSKTDTSYTIGNPTKSLQLSFADLTLSSSSGDISFNGNLASNIQAPINNTDAANKQYVDNLIQNLIQVGTQSDFASLDPSSVTAPKFFVII